MNHTPLTASAGHSPYYAPTTSSSSSRMLVASRKERCSGKMLILAVFLSTSARSSRPSRSTGIWSITPYSSRTDNSSVTMGTRDKTEQNLIYKLEKGFAYQYTSVTATLYIITTLYTSCRDFPRRGAVQLLLCRYAIAVKSDYRKANVVLFVRISMRYGTWLSTAKLDIQAQFPRLIFFFFQNLECFALALSLAFQTFPMSSVGLIHLPTYSKIQAFATLMPSHHSLHSNCTTQ